MPRTLRGCGDGCCADRPGPLTYRRMLQRRNALYRRRILGQMKIHTAAGAGINDAEDSAVVGSWSIWEYDEVFIAPRHGFAGAEDCTNAASLFASWAASACRHWCWARWTIPALPGALYSSYDWSRNKALMPLLPTRGGHVGFHGSAAAIPGATSRMWRHSSRTRHDAVGWRPGCVELSADVRDGLGPYLAIYLLTVQKWDAASIGVVMSIGGIAGILAQTPAGYFIDVTS